MSLIATSMKRERPNFLCSHLLRPLPPTLHEICLHSEKVRQNRIHGFVGEKKFGQQRRRGRGCSAEELFEVGCQKQIYYS